MDTLQNANDGTQYRNRGESRTKDGANIQNCTKDGYVWLAVTINGIRYFLNKIGPIGHCLPFNGNKNY